MTYITIMAGIAVAISWPTLANAQPTTTSMDSISVRDFGAKGDCTNDDSPPIRTAIKAGAGKSVFFPVPASCYKLLSGIGTVPPNTRLQGANKQSTKIQRAFNGGEIMELADGVSLDNLYLEGDGANYRGKGVVVTGTNGNQSVSNARIINFNGSPVEFTTTTAGSRSSWTNLEVWQTGGLPGSGKYAFVNAEGRQLLAVPKSFVHIETSGFCSFYLGGANNVYITNSFLGDLEFTANTRAVNIVASRIANQVAMTLNGHNNSIVGSDVRPTIAIAPGATANVLGPGSFNSVPPVIDSSGNTTNLVTHSTVGFNPALTAASSAATLGDGRLAGAFSRQGAQVFFTIEFVVGRSTQLGTGELRFGIPVRRTSSSDAQAGWALIRHAGTVYTAMGNIAAQAAYISFVREGSGAVTSQSPITLSAGDTIRITGVYGL
jgi:hypothetical protein